MFGNSCLGTTQYGGTGRSNLWDIWQKIYRQTIFIWNVIHAWTFQDKNSASWNYQDKKTAEWGYKDKNSASWTYKNKS